jgi:hypothetical protein
MIRCKEQYSKNKIKYSFKESREIKQNSLIESGSVS